MLLKGVVVFIVRIADEGDISVIKGGSSIYSPYR